MVCNVLLILELKDESSEIIAQPHFKHGAMLCNKLSG